MDGSLCSQSTERRCMQDGSFVCQEFGWVGFFFPLGISYSLECNLGLRDTLFFFFLI